MLFEQWVYVSAKSIDSGRPDKQKLFVIAKSLFLHAQGLVGYRTKSEVLQALKINNALLVIK